MFVLDIVSFYGRAVATGDLASWNKLLSAGYVPGNRLAAAIVSEHQATDGDSNLTQERPGSLQAH